MLAKIVMLAKNSEAAIPLVMDAMGETNPETDKAATSVLLAIGEVAVPQLISRTHQSPCARAEALTIIERMGPRATPALLRPLVADDRQATVVAHEAPLVPDAAKLLASA